MRFTPVHASLLGLLLACGGDDSGGSQGDTSGAHAGDAGSHSAQGNDAGSSDGHTGAGGGLDASTVGGSSDAADAGASDDGDDGAVRHRDGGRTRDAGSTTPPTTTSDASVDSDSLAQHCVDTINMYRATLGLAPYARQPSEESCVDSQAAADGASGKAHGAFGMCHESAQDECPGWSSKDIEGQTDKCLAQMWAEGPGDFNAGHGHYINMSSTKYTKVACGYHDLGNGKFWATQDFF